AGAPWLSSTCSRRWSATPRRRRSAGWRRRGPKRRPSGPPPRSGWPGAARRCSTRGRRSCADGRGGRRLVLEARHRLLGRVLAAARARLPEAMATPEYRAALPAALGAALACAGDAAVVVRCPPALAAAVRDALPRASGAAVEADSGVRAGFTLATADGVLTVDDTLDGRLERLWPRLAPGVLARVEERGP